jgi:hypothetical protein
MMHMCEIFKFEFVVWLDLNSKRKIKRKGNRNSEEKGKPQNSPPPSLPMTSGSYLLMPARVRARCPISLYQWVPLVGTTPLTCAPSPADPACQLPLLL